MQKRSKFVKNEHARYTLERSKLTGTSSIFPKWQESTPNKVFSKIQTKFRHVSFPVGRQFLSKFGVRIIH